MVLTSLSPVVADRGGTFSSPPLVREDGREVGTGRVSAGAGYGLGAAWDLLDREEDVRRRGTKGTAEAVATRLGRAVAGSSGVSS